MLYSKLIVGVMCLAAVAGGCNRSRGTPSAPSSRPAAAPATSPVAAVLTIDGDAVSFASPEVRIDRQGDSSRMLIYSRDGAASGGFYLELPFDDAEQSDDGWDIQWRKDEGERSDSPVGINLARAGQTLQPTELKVMARRLSDGLISVNLTGRFAVYAGDDPAPTTTVDVAGAFMAHVAR